MADHLRMSAQPAIPIRVGAVTAANDLRLGFIGCGRHATANLYPSIAAIGARLTSIATRNSDGAAAAASRHGAQHSHGDYRTMLATDHLDAVFISVGPNDQVAIVEDCLSAGVHVFVEKPLGLTQAEAQRVADVAATTERIVMVGFMKRFAPSYLALQSVMADTASFGDPMSFAATFAFSPWTNTLRDDTFLTLAAIHMVDLIRATFGEITDVRGYRNSRDADINMALSMCCASGVVGTVNLASLNSWARGHESLTVTGGHGYVTATDLSQVRYHLDQAIVDEPPRWQTLDEHTVVLDSAISTASGGAQDLFLRGFAGEVAHFLDCIREHRQPPCSAADNVATMALCERILASLDETDSTPHA